MKKILAIAAVAALTAGVSAYAANPFSDVSPDDWAYQAVSDLSDQGVVEGYPDGTFKGERNMTRYELAQVIARLMAREDQLNAEQKATLDKLAGEYADELANLGVRVSNLEKKVGNISWFGDARMRWKEKGYNTDGSRKADGWDGRMRINAKAQVNDSTYVRGRFTSNMNFKDDADANTKMDVLFVHHQFGDKVGMNLGRNFLTLGQTGMYYDDFFDGAQLFIGDSKLTLEAGYGRMNTWINDYGQKKDDTVYARLYGKTGRIGYDAEYIKTVGAADADKKSIWGAGLTVGVTDAVDIFGDFYKNTEPKGDPQMWTAGLGFGHYNLKKPGTFRVAAQYVRNEAGAYFGGSTYTAFPASSLLNVDSKFWLANADVVLAKNVRLHGEYAFNVKTDDSVDYDDLATVSLNYNF
ncbi:S-layer homology domain-containing protein [Dialister invisus]|uniref:S-layer homology domain-containing protein n=1 Tax=Dialister invisus TaxID=218538 RepID=UPI001D07C5FA|nr:S-layer homology domain-containing protein [Dialister invisus]MCB6181709.1 S-layer homology domain-containing protein [Dialister invisus]